MTAISQHQNVAITLAKAYHLLATCLGDRWHIDNASEHLDCALDGDAATFDFDACQLSITTVTDILIANAQTSRAVAS